MGSEASGHNHQGCSGLIRKVTDIKELQRVWDLGGPERLTNVRLKVVGEDRADPDGECDQV